MEEDHEQIERWLNALFAGATTAYQLEAIVRAETFGLSADAMDIIGSLPPEWYTRPRLTDQLNSAIVARGLPRSLGTFV